jgi:pyrroloquinoline quinone biosynthesis protein B
LIIKVLGAGAGGGFPQWNCNTRLSRLAWDGDERVNPRTQSSVAVSANGESWVIVNASPDLRRQIAVTPELQPRREGALRNSPIAAVVLTNGDIDHIAGLLSMRERQAFSLYATPRVLSVLKQNRVFDILVQGVVDRLALPLNAKVEIANCGGLTVEAFPVHGKVALYLEDPSKEGFGTELGDTIGLKIAAPGSASLFYIPGCASVDDELLARVHGAGALLFDGTLFTDSEVVDLGVLDKTSRRMGHVPITGEGSSLHAFDGAQIAKKAFIHINTTNPILERGSAAERTVKSAGWEISHDGMTLTL